MVVVPPPVIAFDWLLPGVAWNGEAWRGAALFGVAWLGGATLSTLAFSLTCYFPRWYTAGYGSYSFLPLSGVNIASALAGNSLLMPMESDTSYNKAEWAISA